VAPTSVKTRTPLARIRWLPVLVVVAGLLATGAGAYLIHAINQVRDREQFERLADEANDAIVDRLETYVAVLRAGAGLFAASQVVDAQEFRAFAGRLELEKRFPGVEGVGYAAATRDGAVRILYLEPPNARNARAMGHDLAADPIRREAIERARDTGQPAMTGKVRLMQEADPRRQAGFLILEPIYAGGAIPGSVEARRARLEGFIYAPFQADRLLENILQDLDRPMLHVAVYDGPGGGVLHQSSDLAPRRDGMRTERALQVAGRTWTVAYTATEALEPAGEAHLVAAFIAVGLLTTGLTAWAMFAQVGARLAAEREVAARKRSEERRKLLLDELNHRVKNTLATVQSVAAQSLRNAPDLKTGRKDFEARLMALSEAHNLLTRDNWRGADLADLAKVELAPYDGGRKERVTLLGEPVWLSPNTAVALGMAFHELATNAAKHGALSGEKGQVKVQWTVDRSGEAPDRVSIVWREAGGPPVSAPDRKGFGSRLILSGLAHQLKGDVSLVFEPDGVSCSIAFNMDKTTSRLGPDVGDAA
jgi:two-component sensor histidine kinase/CHASE1-domain containing sensor protein